MVTVRGARGEARSRVSLNQILNRLRSKNAGVFALELPRGVSRPPLGQGAVRGTVMARVRVLNLVLNTSKTRVRPDVVVKVCTRPTVASYRS